MCTIKLRTTVLGVPTNPEPLDRQLCFSLYAATRAVTGLYREVLSEFGLTFPQYLVLLALWDQDGLTVRELGERLQLDSGTLSPLLRRLERAGYTNREHSVEDARVVHVHLTREGDALRSQGGRIQGCLVDNLDLTYDEASTLHALAHKVTDQARGRN